MEKLNEEEIAWLMHALDPGNCKSCIWCKEEEKFQCYPNGKAPCQIFADKVFHGLELAGLI
ncbi:MAG: hypothetical protein ACUVWV_05120 [Thermodesulfobacteriota bacterium]